MSVTFGLGATAAASIAAICTVSAFSAWSSTSVSPTVRPLRLARRTPVSPGAAGAPRVVGWVAHVATGPYESISIARVEKNGVAATTVPDG